MNFDQEMRQRVHEKLNNRFWADVRDRVMASAHLGAVYTDPENAGPAELADALLSPLRKRMMTKLRELEQEHFLNRRATGEYIEFDHHVMYEFMRDYAVNYPDHFDRGATMVNVELSGPEVKGYVSQWLNSPETIEEMEDGDLMPDSMLVLHPWDPPDANISRVATIADMARQRTCFHGCNRSCGWTAESQEVRYERHRTHVHQVEAKVALLRDLQDSGITESVERVASELDEMLSLNEGSVSGAIRNGWPI